MSRLFLTKLKIFTNKLFAVQHDRITRNYENDGIDNVESTTRVSLCNLDLIYINWKDQESQL